MNGGDPGRSIPGRRKTTSVVRKNVSSACREDVGEFLKDGVHRPVSAPARCRARVLCGPSGCASRSLVSALRSPPPGGSARGRLVREPGLGCSSAEVVADSVSGMDGVGEVAALGASRNAVPRRGGSGAWIQPGVEVLDAVAGGDQVDAFQIENGDPDAMELETLRAYATALGGHACKAIRTRAQPRPIPDLT